MLTKALRRTALVISLVAGFIVLTAANNSFAVNLPVTGQTTSYDLSAPASADLLWNGGFEIVNDAWTEYDDQGYVTITDDSSNAPHGGSRYAWLGGTASGTNYIYEDVAIPSSAAQAYLQFWYNIATDDTSAADDTLSVQVLNPADDSVLSTLAGFSNADSTGGWVQSAQYDVSAFKGQTIRVRFYAQTDATLNTDFLIDDVSLSATGITGLPGTPTAVSATAGNAAATVSFLPPSGDAVPGRSYTVTSAPGGITATGASSPITVTGLTNGTAYTFTLTAANATGTGPASTPSNSVMPSAALSSPFHLPDTGQTTCYDTAGNVIACGNSGQDGEYAINPMSYTDNGDGTVTDNNTGLMWQQQDDGHIYNWYQASGVYDAAQNTFPQNVCGSLNLGGYSDWRLPTEQELLGLVDYSIDGPTIAPIFTNTQEDSYWSSSVDADIAGDVWTVDFYIGYDDGSCHKYDSAYVRCVRGGRYPQQNLADNGNGTVSDAATGLMWQQAGPGTMAWDAAVSYCNGLSLGGYTDWRLPDIKELASLSDDTKYDPAVDAVFFPNASGYYWSATTNAGYPDWAWEVDSFDGWIDDYGKSNTDDNVRCVRGGQSDKIGVYDNGLWYLDSNMNWRWDGNSPDTLGVFGVGLTGAVPVVGDWNNDGTTKIGVFINGTWYLDMNRNWQWDGEPTDKMDTFGAGLAGAVPVVGDWNHSGTTKIGIYVNGTWYLDVNGNGQWDGKAGGDRIAYFGVGLTGAVPVVGDWNGDGTTKIGVYQNGYWYLDTNGNGQWDGKAGGDTLGVFGIGLTNAVPVVGDWNADGTDEIGIYQQGIWYLDKNRNWQWDGDSTDQYGVFGIGLTGAVPVPGKW